MAVSQVGMFLPGITHWYSTHAEMFQHWFPVRRLECGKGAYLTHSKHAPADVIWPLGAKYARTSGLAAAIVGCELGYDEVVLAGLPADDGGHFYPSDRFEEYGQDRYRFLWEALRDNYFNGRVTSLSGNTREWLGK